MENETRTECEKCLPEKQNRYFKKLQNIFHFPTTLLLLHKLLCVFLKLSSSSLKTAKPMLVILCWYRILRIIFVMFIPCLYEKRCEQMIFPSESIASAWRTFRWKALFNEPLLLVEALLFSSMGDIYLRTSLENPT